MARSRRNSSQIARYDVPSSLSRRRSVAEDACSCLAISSKSGQEAGGQARKRRRICAAKPALFLYLTRKLAGASRRKAFMERSFWMLASARYVAGKLMQLRALPELQILAKQHPPLVRVRWRAITERGAHHRDPSPHQPTSQPMQDDHEGPVRKSLTRLRRQGLWPIAVHASVVKHDVRHPSPSHTNSPDNSSRTRRKKRRARNSARSSVSLWITAWHSRVKLPTSSGGGPCQKARHRSPGQWRAQHPKLAGRHAHGARSADRGQCPPSATPPPDPATSDGYRPSPPPQSRSRPRLFPSDGDASTEV